MNSYTNPEQRTESRKLAGAENLAQPIERRVATLREADHIIVMLSRMYGNKTLGSFVDVAQQDHAYSLDELRKRKIAADESAVNETFVAEAEDGSVEAARKDVEQARKAA